MRVRTIAALCAAGVVVSAVPAVAQSAGQEAGESTEEQDPAAGVKRQLEQNARDLDDAADRLAAAERLLDLAAQRETAAIADLAVITEQLSAARERESEAIRRARNRAQGLSDEDDAVTTGRLDREAEQARLAHRVVWVWKHGAAADTSLRLRMAAGARTPHDLLVGRRVVDQLVEGSRSARDEADARLEAAITGRSTQVSGRDGARREAFDASVQAGTIDLLERRQLAIVSDLQAARAEQQAVYDAIEADREALAALSQRLRQTLARITLTGALVPPADLPLDGPPPPWVNELPSAGATWATAVDAIAVRHGVDGALFTALVWSESGFHPLAVSRAGAIGLAQLMPGTANGLGVDPWDPYQNLAGGARYLHAQIQRFGQVDLGLAAYNAGPGAVQRAGNQIPGIAETEHYVIRVLERWERLRQAA